MLEAIIRSHAAQALGECCGLLAAAAQGPFARAPGRLSAAATALIAAVPDQRPASADPAVIADLVALAERINIDLAVQLAEQLLASPQSYDFDQTLVPAMTRLLQSSTASSGPAMSRLVPACLAHLESRAALPLEAPRDWSRPATIRCSCPHCTELGRFLKSPDTLGWTFRAAEYARAHVEESIRQARADLDVTTERRGRPYALICKKNSASYERRVTQRSEDLSNIAALKGS